jgi:hypothetical protein
VDGLELFERTDFARGVTRQRKSEFVFLDPAPIINHSNPSDATRLEPDLNGLSARIDGIFYQFFENGSRSFDHFARSDLTHEQIG